MSVSVDVPRAISAASGRLCAALSLSLTIPFVLAMTLVLPLGAFAQDSREGLPVVGID